MESIDYNSKRSMTMSFSCSSLQRSGDIIDGQEQSKSRFDRPYNSLTKRRKEINQENCQRNWTSRDDCKDDFWSAIRSNYDYIMDTNLIDSCKEANRELTWDEGDGATLSWGLKEVSCQFSELYAWLSVLQELVYSKEENLLDKSLRAAHMEELRRKAYRRRLFNDQSTKLVARTPSLKDEVAWRVDHLNAKWELVEQIMAPTQPTSDHQNVSADFEHEVKCLKKWLREMDTRLKPLSFRKDWSRSELEEKATEHMVLQKDIEAHGRIVNSVVKLSERVSKQNNKENQIQSETTNHQEQQQQQQQNPIYVAKTLERRWHLLFLSSLEWQCRIELLANPSCTKNSVTSRCTSDSDEEPVIKQPRLSRRQSRESGRDNSSCSSGRSGRSSLVRRINSSRNSDNESSCSSSSSCYDSDMSFKNQNNNDDESYFEDDLEEFCVTETKHKVYRSSNSKSSVQGDQGEEGDIEEGSEPSDDEMTPTLDPAVSQAVLSIDEIDGKAQNSDTLLIESTKRRRDSDESTLFNTSDRKSKNCATFYFKHRDTDSEADCQRENMSNNISESSEEEWTYTASPTDNCQTTTFQEKKTNVVVRLDFDEPATIEKIEDMNIKKEEIIESKNNDMKIVEEDDEDINNNDKIINENIESEDDTKHDIKKLIHEVEKLVSEDGRKNITACIPKLNFDNKGQNNYRAKYIRIKEWLKLNSNIDSDGRSPISLQLDSCDASGEYTTGESDIEKQSETSEDLQSSVATYRRCDDSIGCVSQSISQEIYNENEKTLIYDNNQFSCGVENNKVVMRAKKKTDGKRPWSVSCVFGQLNTSNDASISQFSISETALHQLVASTPLKSASLDAGSKAPFHSASTLEENGRSVRNSFLRKKKSRLRKKTLSRKSESGSDGVNANHSAGSDTSSTTRRRSTMRKSLDDRARTVPKDCHRCIMSYVTYGSTISCRLHHHESMDKAIVTDPPPSIKLTCYTPDSSSIDTEENNCGRKKFDNLIDNVFNRKDTDSPFNNIDSDIEKISLENNSFSEQAWDSYQEKYMSEPYSETADVESARKLLDFGDDYRNFLDSQSDCASSLSAVGRFSPAVVTTNQNIQAKNMRDSSEDSDNDEDELRRVIDRSYKKLLVMESHFSRANNLRLTKDMMDVNSICEDNLKCLQTVIESSNHKGEKFIKQIRGLIVRWQDLSNKVEESQRASVLQRELAAMDLEFRAIHEKLVTQKIILEPDHVLDERINEINSELAMLKERKNAMLALNVSAHRLITDLGSSASSVSISLKDDVADLYRVWDETFQRGNQQLCAVQAVQQFGARLTELQNALRKDKDTLAVLDAALQAGATPEVASSVRDVARLLSEKQDGNNQIDIKDGIVGQNYSEPVIMSLGQEAGTYSDSGISDSGSEQELSERERRLSALRRLTRSLESQLTPGSDALTELWRRVEDAEAELRCLQKQCRELIVRTAASVETKIVNRNSQPKYSTSKRKKRQTTTDLEKNQKSKHIGNDDPDDDPYVPKSWVWRILKAALPFQLAIVALFCAVCLLEPHCCEAANGLSLSLTPQLRFVRGPPPV